MAIAGVILGSIALVGTMITFAHIFAGRPNLTMEFNTQVLKRGSVMLCELYNLPTRNKLLRFIGVQKRPIEDVAIALTIANGKEIIHREVPDIISRTGVPDSQRVQLPPSTFPAKVAIANVLEGKISIFSNNIILKPNIYHVVVVASSEGQKVRATSNLNVSGTPPYAKWETLNKYA
ncbi:hypothetical protein ACFLTS_04530 [Chloroflexota bacterium]